MARRNTRTERLCPICTGAGTVPRNDSFLCDPQAEYDVTCPHPECDGGWIRWAPIDPLDLLKDRRQHARCSWGARPYGEMLQRAVSPVNLPADSRWLELPAFLLRAA